MEITLKKAKKPLKSFVKYPFAHMEINEYFEVDQSNFEKVRGAAHSYGFRHGKKFSVVMKNGKGYCQRIA